MRDLNHRVEQAVRRFWKTRQRQKKKQEVSGKKDQGARGAVTGGSQLDGFIDLVTELLVESGIPDGSVYRRAKVDVFLPGFFRPTKE